MQKGRVGKWQVILEKWPDSTHLECQPGATYYSDGLEDPRRSLVVDCAISDNLRNSTIVRTEQGYAYV